MNISIQEPKQLQVKWTQNFTLGYIIIKLLKDKEKILQAAKEKCFVAYKGSSKDYKQNSYQKLWRSQKQWANIFKVLKEKKNLSAKNYIFGKTVLKKIRENNHITAIYEMKVCYIKIT